MCVCVCVWICILTAHIYREFKSLCLIRDIVLKRKYVFLKDIFLTTEVKMGNSLKQ